MIGSALPAKWKPHTRQSFRLSFRSSTRCKRERELQAAQRRRAHKRSSHTQYTYYLQISVPTNDWRNLPDGRWLAPLPGTEDPISFSPNQPPLRSLPPSLHQRPSKYIRSNVLYTCSLYATPLTPRAGVSQTCTQNFHGQTSKIIQTLQGGVCAVDWYVRFSP